MTARWRRSHSNSYLNVLIDVVLADGDVPAMFLKVHKYAAVPPLVLLLCLLRHKQHHSAEAAWLGRCLQSSRSTRQQQALASSDLYRIRPTQGAPGTRVQGPQNCRCKSEAW
jgi:hypothetical protein